MPPTPPTCSHPPPPPTTHCRRSIQPRPSPSPIVDPQARRARWRSAVGRSCLEVALDVRGGKEISIALRYSVACDNDTFLRVKPKPTTTMPAPRLVRRTALQRSLRQQCRHHHVSPSHCATAELATTAPWALLQNTHRRSTCATAKLSNAYSPGTPRCLASFRALSWALRWARLALQTGQASRKLSIIFFVMLEEWSVRYKIGKEGRKEGRREGGI